MKTNPILNGLDTIVSGNGEHMLFLDTSTLLNGFSFSSIRGYENLKYIIKHHTFTSSSLGELERFITACNQILVEDHPLYTSHYVVEEIKNVANLFLGKINVFSPSHYHSMKKQFHLLLERLKSRVTAYDHDFVFDRRSSGSIDSWVEQRLKATNDKTSPSHTDIHLVLLALYQIAKPEQSRSSAIISADEGHLSTTKLIFDNLDGAPAMSRDFKRLLRNRIGKKKRSYDLYLRNFNAPFSKVYSK